MVDVDVDSLDAPARARPPARRRERALASHRPSTGREFASPMVALGVIWLASPVLRGPDEA
ncbi:MAG: hypothetical protein M3P85_05890 [Actinomycetota bacterium]|nr:hypothetical protein [Actinomycetota bacterium]